MNAPPAADSGPAERRELLVITGLSGAGKSLAQSCLEDLGFFCVDNLPVELIPKFVDLQARGGPALDRVALTVDVREREFLGQFPAVYADLKARRPDVQLLFVEAEDEALRKRFSETRRPHPLGGGRTVTEGIEAERELLAPLRADADIVLDTTELTPAALRQALVSRFATTGRDQLQVTLISFAYRHGLPREADMVFDVRFLPNPHYLADLKPLTGRHEPVRRFLAGQAEHGTFMDKLLDLLDFVLPAQRREGKAYLTLAIGCTGGRHRSVAVVEALHEELSRRGVVAGKLHRDVDREAP